MDDENRKRDAANAALPETPDSAKRAHVKTPKSQKKTTALTLIDQDHEYALFHNNLAVVLQAAYGDTVSAIDKQRIVNDRWRLKVRVRKLEHKANKLCDRYLQDLVKPRKDAMNKFEPLQATIRAELATIQQQKVVAVQRAPSTDPIGTMCDELILRLQRADEKIEAAKAKLLSALPERRAWKREESASQAPVSGTAAVAASTVSAPTPASTITLNTVPAVGVRTLTHDDFVYLMQHNQRAYPMKKWVSPQTLGRWLAMQPQLGMRYPAVITKPARPDGYMPPGAVCVIIPMSETGWGRLVRGEIAENDISEGDLFSEGDQSVCLHVYHIEKFDATIRGLVQQCLQDVNRIISQWRTTCRGLRVSGVSGLGFTVAGIHLAYNTLNMREGAFLCSDHVLKRDEQTKVVSGSDIARFEQSGWRYAYRMKLFVAHHEDLSRVWSFLTQPS